MKMRALGCSVSIYFPNHNSKVMKMKTKSLLKIAFTATIALGLAANANSKPQGNGGDAGILHHYPRPDYSAYALVPYKTPYGLYAERRVFIHQLDPNLNKPGVYFHRPTFALVERTGNPLNLDGVVLPSFVHGVDVLESGTTIITLRFQLTSNDIQQLCRKAVIAQDLGAVIKKLGENKNSRPPQDLVSVEKWPIESVFVDCMPTYENRVLSAGGKRVVTADDAEFYIHLPFSRDSFLEFLALEEKGKLAFRFSYSYTGATTVKSELDVFGDLKLVLETKNVLTQQQIDGEAPIFRRHKNKVIEAMKLQLIAVSRIGHPKLMPQAESVIPALINQIFNAKQSLTLAEVTKLYPDADRALAEYLLPDLQTLQEAEEIENLEVEVEQDGTLSTTKVGGGLFASYAGIVGISFDVADESTHEKLNRLEKKHGVTFSKGKTLKQKVASSIDVVKLATGWDQVNVDLKTVKYLSLGDETQYRIESDVPQQFTDQFIAKAIATELKERSEFVERQSRWEYDSVPLGTMLPYFGASVDPPKGYVFADGKTNWPDESWVPKHFRWPNDASVAVELRGKPKPVPDMENFMLAGGNVNQVGHEHLRGQADVSGTVKAATIKIDTRREKSPGDLLIMRGGDSDNQDVYITSQVGKMPLFADGNSGQPIFQLKTRMYAIPGEVTAKATGNSPTKTIEIEGKAILDNIDSSPPHVKCRWIIRVR